MLITNGSPDGWHGACGFCGSVADDVACPQCGLWSGAQYDLDAEPIKASWTATVKQDDTGDFFITVPQPVLDKMGWQVDDKLTWTLNEDGSATVQKI